MKDPGIPQVKERLLADYDKISSSFRGMLINVTSTFRKWLIEKLEDEVKRKDNEISDKIYDIIKEPVAYFQYKARLFHQQLGERLLNEMRIALPEFRWQVVFTGINAPDISVYRVFDSHIDTLMFFFTIWFFPFCIQPDFQKADSYGNRKKSATLCVRYYG